jgi:hypothetical protein
MGVAARVMWCWGWMLRCAQQLTMARRERWLLSLDLGFGFGFGSAGHVGVGLQGHGRLRLNRSKISSDKIGVPPSPLPILTPPGWEGWECDDSGYYGGAGEECVSKWVCEVW